MPTLKALRDVFKETLRLFRKDPAGMVGVTLRRIFGGMDDAKKRLDKVYDDEKKRKP